MRRTPERHRFAGLRVDETDNAIAPRRQLSDAEWEQLIGDAGRA